MKRLYTIALSALVLAASASVAVPTMKLSSSKTTKSTQIERIEVVKQSQKIQKRQAPSRAAQLSVAPAQELFVSTSAPKLNAPESISLAAKNAKVNNIGYQANESNMVCPKKAGKIKMTKVDATAALNAKKTPRKAEESDGISGTYEITIGDYYITQTGEYTAECTVTEDTENNVVWFDCDEFPTSVYADYDAATGIITFNTFPIGQVSTTSWTRFEPFVYDYEIYDIIASSFTAAYNAETGNIEFEEDYGFSWPVYNDAEYTDQKAGYYYGLFDVLGLTPVEVQEEEEEVTWTLLDGKGKWFEGLLSVYSDIDAGISWDIEIEECDQTPGIYRIYPYASQNPNPISDLLGGRYDNATYLIVNTVDPNKVYVTPAITPFGLRTFAMINSENNFSGDYYGTLTDGIINFPVNSFAYQSGSSWYVCNRDGAFKIALPGAVITDYSLKATIDDMCAPENIISVNINAGDDIAKIKVWAIPGWNTVDESVTEYVDSYGQEFESGLETLNLTLSQSGMTSVLINGYNADGEIVAYTSTHCVYVEDNDSEWKDFNGTAVWSEGFLSNFFSDITAEDINVTVQENISTPGLYRVVNPYANYQQLSAVDHTPGHNHYLYINAVDPTKVYVEMSAVGMKVNGFGSLFASSYPDYYIQNGLDPSVYLGDTYFGTFENNVFTLPNRAAMFGFNNEPYNSYYLGELTLTLTPDEVSEPEATDVTFDFVNNQYGIDNERGGSAYFTEASIDSVGVHIDFVSGKGNGFRFWSDGLRIYKTSGEYADTISISAPGHVISTVTVEAAAAFGSVKVNGAEDSETVAAGKNYYNCGNAETATLAFCVTDNKAIVSLTVTLDGEAGEQPDEPVIETVGEGTEENPYTVADVIKLNNSVSTGWVKGVIVGAMVYNDGIETEDFTTASNIVLAESIDETEVSNMVIVQLVSGTEIREALNLVDNPENLGKSLEIEGSLEAYFGQPGIKAPTAYKLEQTPDEPEADPNEGWTSIGNATFMDGWVLPLFGIDQTDENYWYQVELQQNDDDENLYRLVNPYQAGFIAEEGLNQYTKNGYIQFNISDPDHVYFDIVAAGYAYSAAGVTQLYCYNYLGWAYAYFDYEYTPDMLVSMFDGNIDFLSSFKDGVVTVPSDEALFGIQGNANGGYVWNDSEGNRANMETRIWFPDVTPSYEPEVSIKEISATEGQETLYNLRGQRINRATVPGIYIRNNQKVYVK